MDLASAVNLKTKMASKGRIRQAKRDKVKFNLMVVGETGLGKTTFLQSLLRKYIDNFDIKHPDEITDKTIHIHKVGKFEILTDTGDGLDIQIYDSPGYGDYINNQEAVNKVKDYILKAHQQWRALDAQSMTEAEFLQADDRIHCVFYFLAPHRMKEIDREFITQLAPLVPIVPIIAKSDIMTITERNYYLDIVTSKLNGISKTINESCVYDFEGDDLAALDEILSPGKPVASAPESSTEDDEIPGASRPNTNLADLKRSPNLFAVICDSGSERVYPWGGLKIDNSQISDFRRLQTILFENELHLKGMLDNTRMKSIRLFGKGKAAGAPNTPGRE